MSDCPLCDSEIDYLEVERVLKQEAILDDEGLQIVKASIHDNKFWCPACSALLFNHEDDARVFLDNSELTAVSTATLYSHQMKGGNEKTMKILRIKVEADKAQLSEKGYYTAYLNENKKDNPNAPDFKGMGIGVWEGELESLDTAEKAVEAGAASPKVQEVLQA